jgi:hypothetical protein
MIRNRVLIIILSMKTPSCIKDTYNTYPTFPSNPISKQIQAHTPHKRWKKPSISTTWIISYTNNPISSARTHTFYPEEHPLNPTPNRPQITPSSKSILLPLLPNPRNIRPTRKVPGPNILLNTHANAGFIAAGEGRLWVGDAFVEAVFVEFLARKGGGWLVLSCYICMHVCMGI